MNLLGCSGCWGRSSFVWFLNSFLPVPDFLRPLALAVFSVPFVFFFFLGDVGFLVRDTLTFLGLGAFLGRGRSTRVDSVGLGAFLGRERSTRVEDTWGLGGGLRGRSIMPEWIWGAFLPLRRGARGGVDKISKALSTEEPPEEESLSSEEEESLSSEDSCPDCSLSCEGTLSCEAPDSFSSNSEETLVPFGISVPLVLEPTRLFSSFSCLLSRLRLLLLSWTLLSRSSKERWANSHHKFLAFKKHSASPKSSHVVPQNRSRWSFKMMLKHSRGDSRGLRVSDEACFSLLVLFRLRAVDNYVKVTITSLSRQEWRRFGRRASQTESAADRIWWGCFVGA